MHPRTPLAAAVDTAVVVTFVAIGRRNHEEADGFLDIARTAAPFLISLGGAWLLLRIGEDRVWDRPTEWSTGVAVWPFTVVFGMLLRKFVFDDGTAASFIIVATAFLGVFFVGWRAIATAITKRSRTAAATH